VVVGGEVAAGLAELPVHRAGGGEGKDALADACPESVEGVGAVVFERELALEGVDDRLNPLAHDKRVRALAPRICALVNHLARSSPSFCDRLRLLDATPVACGQSRETVKRSDLAGYAAYGYCAAHSRHFWGFKLYLLCAPDGMPITFCLAAANEPEREVAAALLDHARRAQLLIGGELIIADKGFSGAEFEQIVASLDATFARPDRRDEKPRFGDLGG